MVHLNDYDWQPVELPEYVKFEQVGDYVAGEVLWFDAEKGDSTMNDEPCGFLDLRTLDGKVVRVCLDNEQKAEKVRNAHPHPGVMLAIKYKEDRTSQKNGKSYKHYMVARGTPKGSAQNA